MNDNDSKELKPVYVYEASNHCTKDNEITLVDLALVIARRKKMIATMIVVSLLIGTAVIFLFPKKYTYSNTIEIGSQFINGNVKLIESTPALMAKITHSYIPTVLHKYQLTNPNDTNKYKIKAASPKGSTIIVLETRGTEKEATTLTDFIQTITQDIYLEHNKLFERIKQNLELQIKLTKSKLQNLGHNSENIAEKTSLQDKIDNYSTQLANLRSTREISPPTKSLLPSGISHKLTLVFALFAGCFIGIFSAFFSEFLTKVKKSNSSLNPN